MSPYRVAEVPRRRPKAVPHVLGRPDLLADARIDLSPVTARNEALEADGNTDIAIESADIVLLRDEVTAVLDARRISSRSYRRVKHNVAQAFTFNGIGIPWPPPGAPGLGDDRDCRLGHLDLPQLDRHPTVAAVPRDHQRRPPT